MIIEEIKTLKVAQFDLYQKTRQAYVKLQAAIKLHEEAARNYQKLKLSYEINDRLIAKEEFIIRDREILNAKKAEKSEKAPQNASWRKVLRAIRILPEAQQKEILANIAKKE